MGARHQKNTKLKKSFNLIERKYDNDLIWRKMVNNSFKKSI